MEALKLNSRKKKRSVDRFRELCNNIKHPNICIIVSQKETERENLFK